MKFCRGCETWKDVGGFSKDYSHLDGLHSPCKICCRIRSRKKYHENSESQKNRAKNWRIRNPGKVRDSRNSRQIERQRFFDELKTTHGCLVCGYKDSACALDLHHLNPKDKSFWVSASTIRLSWKSVILEIEKCVVLCAICHRRVENGELTLPVGTAPINEGMIPVWVVEKIKPRSV